MTNTWHLRTRNLDLNGSPKVMGILNLTPDSFSDGGSYPSVDAAVDAALRMEDAGAALLDIGGESTRPYSDSVATREEIQRIAPVLERLQGRLSIPISIDTSKADVALAAIERGAEIINDVTGLEGDPRMLDVAAKSSAGICVMHMQGTPKTMQASPTYKDVVSEVIEYLQQRVRICVQQGISRKRICIDPGIGFGKSHAHNLTLLRNIRQLTDLDLPVLVGHSRKGMIAKLLKDKVRDRDPGTLGISLAMAAANVDILRVHAVRMTVDALALFNACRTESPAACDDKTDKP